MSEKAVADHEPMPVLVGELVDVGGDLGSRAAGEHPPRAVTDDLVDQRPAWPCSRSTPRRGLR